MRGVPLRCPYHLYIKKNKPVSCFSCLQTYYTRSYRKKMQCFRHCTDEAIAERKTYSEEQKIFLVDYGLTIVKAIYKLVKKEYGSLERITF